MARTDDGEFELILGNKQLLSVFFIVVVLLGVFFTMGYIVGKNSGSVQEIASTKKADPIMVDPVSPRTGAPAAADPRPADPVPTPEPKPITPPPPPEPVPVRKQEPPPEPIAPVKKQEPVKKAEPKETPKPEPVKPPPAPVLTGGQPPSGQYLQVVASSRPDCEMISDVLRRKGFATVVVPGPNEKLYRVVVGPLADPATIARTRTGLEQAGFQRPILRKY